MRFFIRKRRQTPTVIIVALIDVLIVLLIFLMVTTTFKQQHAVKLALPESSQAKKTGEQANPPLVVMVDAKGEMRLDGVAGLHEVPVNEGQLRSELLSILETNAELALAISADKDAPFGQVIKVMDAAKEAKIKTINAYTKEPAQP